MVILFSTKEFLHRQIPGLSITHQFDYDVIQNVYEMYETGTVPNLDFDEDDEDEEDEEEEEKDKGYREIEDKIKGRNQKKVAQDERDKGEEAEHKKKKQKEQTDAMEFQEEPLPQKRSKKGV